MRRLILLVVAALALSTGVAQATVHLESTPSGGLKIEDIVGHRDQLSLRMRSTSAGLKYEVHANTSCGTACFEITPFELGPGCRRLPDQSIFAIAECDRVAARVSVFLGAGDDLFDADLALKVNPPPPVVDPITASGSTGDDHLVGGRAEDTLNGGSGDDRLEGRSGGDE